MTAQNIRVIADNFIEEVKDNTYDMIVCPGGLPNAQILGKNKTLIEMLKKQKSEGIWYCAICASPFEVFESNGLLEGEKGTGYPGYGKFKDESKLKERVVVSNKCITSQGPCSAFEFGYALCEVLFGKDKKEELQAARRTYNSNVKTLNKTIVVFPSSFVANKKGITKRDYFEAEEQKRQDVKMDFS
mgnify:CR=1 FL=1